MAVEPFCLYVLGRLHGVGRERLDRAVAAAGGRRVRQPSARVTVVALGHTSASHVLEAGIAQLPGGVPAGAELVSEIQLKRRLGLAAQGPAEQRQLTAADLARTAGLAEETVRWLTLYDVLDGEGGRFGFRDLRAAREVKRLLGDGYPVCAIVAAAAALRRSGRGLHDTALAEAPWGEILQKTTGRLARLDGQYILPLDEAFESADALFERAESCELEGDLAGAERLYRIAGIADPVDPVIPYNLGNVLDGLARPREAAVAYRQAIARDPTFAEAWVNLAALHERQGRIAETQACLEQALEARADDGAALFGLASLFTRQERYREALSLWDRYLALGPDAPDRDQARRRRMLCGLAVANQPSSAPRPGALPCASD